MARPGVLAVAAALLTIWTTSAPAASQVWATTARLRSTASFSSWAPGRPSSDKARGVGGVYIDNFSINGQTGDPRTLPGLPEDWKPYFGPGRGGVQPTDTVRADPRCVAKAGAAPVPGPCRCSERGRGPLGPPVRKTRGVERWCTADGGKLSAGFQVRPAGIRVDDVAWVLGAGLRSR